MLKEINFEKVGYEKMMKRWDIEKKNDKRWNMRK